MQAAASSNARVALVTGASKGIGQAVAERLGRDGVTVVVHYGGDAAGAAETARRVESVGGRAHVVSGNVARAADVERIFGEVEARFGGLDVVVNNAGVNMGLTPIANLQEADFDRLMETNAKGSFLVLREAARRVREGGRIVSTSTTLVVTARPGFGAYVASKAAIEGMTRVLARELGPKRITVNAVAPGPVDTALFRTGKTEAQIKMSSDFSVFGRLGTPEEIAAVVAFLAGPEASWVTGQVVRANGGWM